MTSISKYNFKVTKRKDWVSPIINDISSISLVIPVRDNQEGIDNFLDKYFDIFSPSEFVREIIIVDNNSRYPVKIKNRFANNFHLIKLIRCSKLGPASARNAGWKMANGEWILFTDSDCLPSESMISGYLNSMDGAIGYAGFVKALGSDRLSIFYENQEVLTPPAVIEIGGWEYPQYLITANCLIWKKALIKTNGFNEEFSFAGGEDVELGLRLLEYGKLSYAMGSVVYHNFCDGYIGFIYRFVRYGVGLRMLNKLHKFNFKPQIFKQSQKGIYSAIMTALLNICFLFGFYCGFTPYRTFYQQLRQVLR